MHNRGTAFFVTTCTGNNFQIYDCDKLGLLFVSPQTELPISVLAAEGDLTYAATGKDILVFKRAKLVTVPSPLTSPSGPGLPLSLSLVFAVQDFCGTQGECFGIAVAWIPPALAN